MTRVYSTETGRICQGCVRSIAQCICKKPAAQVAEGDGIVRIHRDRKNRGGKEVSVITGIPLPTPALELLGKELKSCCGTGGTVKEGNIEIQGDHRERLKTLLEDKGYTVKLAGS
ncbi:MAG: stress response translation initiation inhibitor YciH [Pseudohongiellaceae bacterium]